MNRGAPWPREKSGQVEEETRAPMLTRMLTSMYVLLMILGVVPDKTWFLRLRSYSKDMCHQMDVAPSWFFMCRLVLFGSNNLCVFLSLSTALIAKALWKIGFQG